MRTTAGVELYWLPLGAGGWFVRMNGRIWEAVHAAWSTAARSTCTTARSWSVSPERPR
jgi:hypothetical protein